MPPTWRESSRRAASRSSSARTRRCARCTWRCANSATAPGSTAADGAGRNGLNTHHLVRQIERPGLAIEEVFKAGRAGVHVDSENPPEPGGATALEGPFAFLQEAP